MLHLPTPPQPIAIHMQMYPHAVDTDPLASLSPKTTSDPQFLGLLNAYRPCGGLARASEVFAMFKSHAHLGAATLERAIVTRSVVCFDWQSTTWMPLFQFKSSDMALHPELEPVLRELRPVFDAWEVASWFARDNGWLCGHAPAEMLASDPIEVLNAARADRFIEA